MKTDLFLLNKLDKYKEYISDIKEISEYTKLKNRELRLNNLTPAIANEIDTIIKFWNFMDDSNILTFSNREPIKIYIDSLGGSLEAALTLMDSIQLSRTPVYTFNVGIVQKESFLVYLAGYKRFAYPNATYSYLNVIKDEETNNNESSFYSRNSMLIQQEKAIKDFILDKISITENQYNKHSKQEWFFSAEDALKIHLCNEILKKHYNDIKVNE